MIRKLYLLGGSLVLLFCVSSIAHSLLVQQAYCPVCDHNMTQVRTIGNARTDNHATFFKCGKCGTGLIR
jgi:hypothetical protein